MLDLAAMLQGFFLLLKIVFVKLFIKGHVSIVANSRSFMHALNLAVSNMQLVYYNKINRLSAKYILYAPL